MNNQNQNQYHINNKRIEVAEGSITRYPADVLVCPANADLEMVAFPGGVQYAFLAEGGQEIFQEASELGKYHRKMSMDTAIPMAVPETSAHLTTAGNLPAKKVLHSVAVGFDKRKRGLYCNADIIARSTKNALERTAEEGYTSIGFPALGTGLYSVPIDEAVEAMITEFENHSKTSSPITRMGLVLYGNQSFQAGKRIADRKLGSLEKRIVSTNIDTPDYQIVEGDMTQLPVDAIMTVINSGGMWFGGIDGAIQRVAGNQYHSQAASRMPLRNLDVVVAKGRGSHRGQFKDVIFVVDDLQSPVNDVIYKGLEAANDEGYETLAIPAVRMGVMAGAVEKTPKETVSKIALGMKSFRDDYGKDTTLKQVFFVVYKDPQTVKYLQQGFRNQKLLGNQ
jgi:O-acetyl-ADP-ribose deacetylase